MITLPLLRVSIALFAVAALSAAEDAPKMPDMPAPVKQHDWLHRFVGDWESDVQVNMVPGEPAIKGKGFERARLLGGFWIVSEGTGEMEGMPGTMTSVMTLGYDPQKNKYVGTWVDSMTSYLWHYEGTVDASGQVLTLETEGPCPMRPGITKFREVIEFKSDDQRVLTSWILEDNGQWTKMVTANYRRKN
jgi:hypothetical protein